VVGFLDRRGVHVHCCAAALVAVAVMAAAGPASALESGAARIGAAPSSGRLQIILPLKADDRGLQDFATAVSTPGSPEYGGYQSVGALGRRFGAPVSLRHGIVAYLRAHGATHVRVDPAGMLAYATLAVPVAERLFATPLARFRARNGAKFIAPFRRAAVPRSLQGMVEGVVGLDTRPVVHADGPVRQLKGASSVFNPAAPPTSEMKPSGTPSGCSGAVDSGGFTPNQYLTAYGYDSLHSRGIRGQGEKLALVEIDGLRDSDLRAFADCFRLDRPAWSGYAVGGLKHLLAPGAEATLDFEVADAVAPDLRQVEVFETANSDQGILAAVSAPLFTPGAKPAVISNSIGLCEPAYRESGDVGALHAEDRELQLMAAAGISFVAAAGDNGAADCAPGQVPHPHRLAVDYPASSPWATAVGGTNLSLTSANQIQSQLVWNDSTAQPGTGGGGGFSIFHHRPSYQSSVVTRNQRALPDVSMLADVAPGYAIYCSAPECGPGNPWIPIGGTSAAAPLLASGIVLVDQDLDRASRELVGFANPLLYALGRSAQGASVFSDVTAYSNDDGATFGDRQPLGCCSAKPGFDEASGWGSVNLTNFDSAAESLLPKVPRVSLSIPPHQRPLESHRALAVIGCSSSCQVGGFLEVAIQNAQAFQVNVPAFSLAAGQHRRVAFRFRRGQERELRRALARHRRVFAEVFALAQAGPGGATVLTAGRQVVIR
jgi:subtilase family serine protease